MKRIPHLRVRLVLLSLMIIVPLLAGQEGSAPAPFKLTIDNIMKAEDLVGTAPSSPSWSWDSQRVYVRWKKPGEPRSELYAVDPLKPEPQKVTPEDVLKRPPLTAASGASFRFGGFGILGGTQVRWNARRTQALVVQNGDISVFKTRTGTTTPLVQTDEPESQAAFTFDEKNVAFVSADNLYLISLADGSLRQLTSFTRKAPPAAVAEPDEIDQWYREQQKELFREFSEKREGRERRGFFPPAAAAGPRRKPFVLTERQNLAGLEAAPGEKSVLFLIREQSGEGKETVVPRYVTESGYTDTTPSHTKAAVMGYDFKAGIMDTASGDVKWIDYGQGERRIFPRGRHWSPDGKHCIVAAQAEDRKDAWLFRLDLATGKSSVLENAHDSAWVGELSLTNVFWDLSSLYLYYISEKDGFAHLYRVSADGQKREQLTRGRFEVREAELASDGRTILLGSNEEHPGEFHFYAMSADGGPRTRLTSREGWNEVTASPDGRFLAVLSSTSTEPAELFLQANRPGAEPRQITLSTTEAFRSYAWMKPEILSFKARDGAGIFARLYVPKVWHEQKPAVIFIHGAGYLQNAHKGWSEYYREYMFHNLLAERGYLIMDVDYRGSAGYGREVRTGIYRHMGGKDLDDIVDAARYLVKERGANPQAIGCYGGSYGGFLTLMAMFKQGEVFKAGAALRPVADWAHYHPYYTVDILNVPNKDPEAYKQSSPIYFAEGLKGALLMCHGMVDSNVHFQDTVRLAQRLIELGKENWEVTFYPVEDHTFRNPSSWTDEYKRIFNLFERNLKRP